MFVTWQRAQQPVQYYSFILDYVGADFSLEFAQKHPWWNMTKANGYKDRSNIKSACVRFLKKIRKSEVLSLIKDHNDAEPDNQIVLKGATGQDEEAFVERDKYVHLRGSAALNHILQAKDRPNDKDTCWGFDITKQCKPAKPDKQATSAKQVCAPRASIAMFLSEMHGSPWVLGAMRAIVPECM